MAIRIRYYFLSYLLAGIFIAGCAPKDKFDRELSFDRNLVNTEAPEVVCRLSEDSVLLRDIVDFTILNDTSFVVTDERGVYLYHISGRFKKQFGRSGRASGEMITPDAIYATPNYVYIWCSSLLKCLAFDHEANFRHELSGFNRAVDKFAVDPSDKIMYSLTSGFSGKSENKAYDVINVYNIAEKTSEKFGERGAEDEFLSTVRNSGGLYADTDRFVYIHPGNLIIYDLDLNSDKTARYKIDDKAFHTTEITTSVRDMVANNRASIEYIFKNSVVKGLFKDNDQFIVFSEIGEIKSNEYNPHVSAGNERKVKLHIFDSSFNPDRTILFDYISTQSIAIHSNYLYFIDTDISGDEQTFSLNRFSLLK